MSSCHARARGFTLIEVLIAITILAIMAALAYRGLTAILATRARVSEEDARLRAMVVFMSRIEHDLGGVVPRPVRGATQPCLPPLEGNPAPQGDSQATVAFTRLTSGDAAAGMRRVGYRLRGEQVEALTWPVLDQAPRTLPVSSVVLSGVSEFSLRYFDQAGNWATQWPDPRGGAASLPRGIELTLKLTDGQAVRRLFALPALPAVADASQRCP